MHHDRLKFRYQLLLDFQFRDWYHLIHPLKYNQEYNYILSRTANRELELSEFELLPDIPEKIYQMYDVRRNLVLKLRHTTLVPDSS